MLTRYPSGLINKSHFRGGPSLNALNYLENVKVLAYAGRVFRFCPDGKKASMDDPYFNKFCREKFGKQPNQLFTEYGLAKSNKIAGYSSLLKYDKLQPDALRIDLWKETLDWAEKHFILMSNSKVLDFGGSREEQIESWSEIESDIEKRASAGYPWSHWFGNKRELFEFRQDLCDQCLDECRLISKNTCPCRCQGFFRDYCIQYWQDLAKEDCKPIFWTNNVKEEIRPMEKLLLNKLRTFIGPSSEHVVANSQMNGDMNQKMYDSVHKHWSFVGGTKFYRGWNKMYRRLSKHPNAFELDESEFDSSLFREAMWGMCEFRWRMLSPEFRTAENRVRLINLYHDIVESYIVTQDGDVVRKDTGNSSGSGNTINDNTVILFRLLSYAWLVLCDEQRQVWSVEYYEQMRKYESFIESVEAALTGDDNTWTCSNEVVGWFNAKSVSRVWQCCGVKTTSPCYEARKLEDCAFLSAGFLRVGDCMVPVPEHAKTMASLAFHDPSPENPRWSLLRACALRIESFWCVESRTLIMDYITWLLREHHAGLHSEQNVNDPKDIFTFTQVFSVFKTDTEIQNLYLLNEGGLTRCKAGVFQNDFDYLYDVGLSGSVEA